MFRSKWGYPEGILIHFVTSVNKIRVQMSYLYLNPYFLDPAHQNHENQNILTESGLVQIWIILQCFILKNSTYK